MKKLLFASLIVVTTPALADVTVKNPTATLTGKGMARVVMTLVTPTKDVLIGASSSVGQATVHTVQRKGTGSIMVKSPIQLPAGAKGRRLSVHGDHVMVMGLPNGTKDVPITLTFANSKPVTVDVVIQ